jgi:hypothetical protein
MLRLGLVAIMGVVAGVLAFNIPGLEVELLGEQSRGLFVFYSAAVPVALLMLTSWLEEGSPVSQLLATGATIGAGAATSVRLAIELFNAAPVITYPFFGALFEDSLADERGWLAINALVAAITAIAAFTSAGDDTPGADD